jgi:hypothetical protein
MAPGGSVGQGKLAESVGAWQTMTPLDVVQTGMKITGAVAVREKLNL